MTRAISYHRIVQLRRETPWAENDMPSPESRPPRDVLDRMLRNSLRHPEHLRAFLEEAVPALAAGFDCTRAHLLEREFPLDDWRLREADLPFEIPYRSGNEELWALVCVLIEHQSDTDPLLPLRMLYFAVQYWDRQWRDWEQLPPPREKLRGCGRSCRWSFTPGAGPGEAIGP